MFALGKDELYKICQEKRDGRVIMAECLSRMRALIDPKEDEVNEKREIAQEKKPKGFDNYTMAIFQYDPLS